jgi:hypothetical protein
MKEILLNALAFAWLNHEIATVDEYMDCVRQVKERFND